LQSFFKLWNIEGFTAISDREISDPIDSYTNILRTLCPDISINLSTSYYKKAKQTSVYIDNFLEKNEKYYIAIGALDLYDNSTDEKVFCSIMENLMNFLQESSHVLSVFWKNRNSQKLSDLAADMLQQYLLQDIKLSLTHDNIKFVKAIFDNKSILDTELAEYFSYNVTELRQILYSLTHNILRYQYNNNSSTILSIDHMYQDTFQENYDDIFKESRYES
jgi:hypothetical protein